MALDGHLALENVHTDGVRCATAQIQSKLGEVLPENQSNLYFDPQLLGSWVVMNIINGIARGGSPCATCPTKSGPEEQTLCMGEEHH